VPIEVKNLTHTYMEGTPFEMTALDKINFRIDDGEFIGIIGHTGSGKSTLIAHLNALIKPQSGTVVVNGMDLGEKGCDLRTVRRTVGLVFQYPEYQLFEETVEKDIAFGPKNMGLDENEIKRRVAYAMEQVGLDPQLGSRSPFDLSGGQKRRVAIAGVLAMQPQILILDEPAAGLDPASREIMLGLIDGIHNSGVTVCMVSHSMDDVSRLCDRLVVLNRGKVAFTGTPAEVFAHEDELREMGLGVPQNVTLINRLRQAGFDLDTNLFRTEDLARAIAEALCKKGAKEC